MSFQAVQLEFLEQYNAFGVADEKISAITAAGDIPLLTLKAEDYDRLGVAAPRETAPTVGFLLGRETGFYTIDFNYAKAIAQSGVQMRFLTYEENVAQLSGVDGLILPGGRFSSPNQFYTDPLKPTEEKPQTRSYAYITSIMVAEKEKMPILGICAGSQMVGGMHGMKMYRDVKEYAHTDIEHKTKTLSAHSVRIIKGTPLYQLIGQTEVTVNSRHTEAMFPLDCISDLKIYAHSPDGTPEAWGNEDKGILCIQWHPEDFAANGDEKMQNIYNWLAGKAHIYQKQKEAGKKRKPLRSFLFNRGKVE